MLLEQIAHHAQNQTEKNAYQSRWGSLTYGELWKKANSLASYLQKENGAVMVCGRKEPLMPIAFVACMLAGRPYLPMDAHLPQERMERIGRIADAKTVLPAYMLPKRFYTVEKMPMTGRGKCDLRKLEEML